MKRITLIAVPLVLMAAIAAVNILGEQSLKPRSGATIMVQPGLVSSGMGEYQLNLQPEAATAHQKLELRSGLQTINKSISRQLNKEEDCCDNTL
ncbi:hypothetical protein [Flavihumibacter sp.]|jgi:hypothetical protein|uniref:hypothetical protein n=1 Tax=Flavihumibacter sp. TaxID=1913981 RepID=UPI002FCA0C50|nr:hypothetical protein [Flavihumibacter sediminis]